MNPGQPSGLRPDLLDDFYAECDELLTSIRGCITRLEQAVRNGGNDAAALEELFRTMHSLKGGCAIAGLRPAEELAHSVEDLLRAATKREIALSAPLLDLLLASTERLNQLIAALRGKKTLPETGDLLPRLAAYLPARTVVEKTVPPPPPSPRSPLPPLPPAPPSDSTDANKPPLPADPVAVARRRGLKIWRVLFSPSAELDRGGVNINTIRQRLSVIGEILSATPAVQPGGGLRFVFMLAAARLEENQEAWQRDGVQFESVEPARGAAGPAATDEKGEAAMGLTPSHIVRVDLGQLDELMRITGEIIIQRSRLETRLGAHADIAEGLRDIDQAMARSLRELRTTVSRVRLVPVAEIFSRMPFVLRDLMRGSDKRARVVLEGEQTEIDKYLVERLKEPLLHLVRNAFAHAVESPEERAAAGKPSEATLTLRAGRAGDSVEIVIADDGRGVDAAAVVARATALGLKVPEKPDAAALLNILCHPGFSTRESADRSAGRGVGMAVVQNTVRELGGTLRLVSEKGRGTQFILRLPLSLSIADALIVVVASQLCALPQGQVDEIFQVAAAEARTIQRTEVVPYRGALLPVTHLHAMFGLPATTGAQLTVAVVTSERGATGLVIDRVHSRREIVIRALTDPLVAAPGVAGATELGDGRPILVLDPAAITAGVVRPPAELLSPASEATESTSA